MPLRHHLLVPDANRRLFHTWRRHLWSSQLLRFLIIGLGNTAFGYTLYLLGLWLGVPYLGALIISTIFGAIFNFFTTGRIVFGSRASERIFRFLASYCVTLSLNLAFLRWLVEAGVAKTYAQAILLPIVVMLSFLLNKHLVFGRSP